MYINLDADGRNHRSHFGSRVLGDRSDHSNKGTGIRISCSHHRTDSHPSHDAGCKRSDGQWHADQHLSHWVHWPPGDLHPLALCDAWRFLLECAQNDLQRFPLCDTWCGPGETHAHDLLCHRNANDLQQIGPLPKWFAPGEACLQDISSRPTRKGTQRSRRVMRWPTRRSNKWSWPSCGRPKPLRTCCGRSLKDALRQRSAWKRP